MYCIEWWFWREVCVCSKIRSKNLFLVFLVLINNEMGDDLILKLKRIIFILDLMIKIGINCLCVNY